MDIFKSIQVFQKVAEAHSFTKAGESLNLVPSAISRQISELEKWLGVRLINRTTRSINLTDDGRKYLDKMAEISSQVEGLRTLGKDNAECVGQVKITAPMMIGQIVAPALLSTFKTAHPKVSISLTLMNRKVDIVEEGFDIAIRAGKLADASFYARKIGNIAFKTVAAKTYLESRPALKTPKDLLAHNCIVNTALANSKRWQYRVGAQDKVIKVSGDIESNESACILSFTKSGLGVAMLPEFYLEEALASGELVEVLSEFIPEPLPLNIVYPSNKLQNPTINALIDFLSTRFELEQN